jgi:hypothetical protein
MQKGINCIQNWILHTTRMPDERIPKQIIKYQSRGCRSIGRPRKIWIEM